MNIHRTFFVTTVTWQRTPLFRNQEMARLILDVLTHYRDQKKYLLHEFVVMPDHLHLLLTPAEDLSVERSMQLIKGGFSYRLGGKKKRLIWQESFTSHRVRDEQDYARHAEYIRMNPVRARLAASPELYPYSSAGGGESPHSGYVLTRAVYGLVTSGFVEEPLFRAA
jgi:REP-associated tyrosine transposase